MTTVPNWIAKAVIVDPKRGEVHPITNWRATKTQVIVRTAPTGPEHRFHLDSLTPVGERRDLRSRGVHLSPPQAPIVAETRRSYATDRACRSVLLAVERERLQDGKQDIETVARKIQAVRDAATKALADLEPFL